MTLDDSILLLKELGDGVFTYGDFAKIAKIRRLAYDILTRFEIPATLDVIGSTDAQDSYKEDVTRYNYKTRLEEEKTKFMKEFIERQVDLGKLADKFETENIALRARLKAIRVVVNEDNDAKGDK